MASPRLLILPALGIAGLIFHSCGGASEALLTPTGGELCSQDRRVCIQMPPQGVAEQQRFRISYPSMARPGGQLSEVWEVEALGKERYRFSKPAVVRIRLEAVDRSSVPDDQLLRIFALSDGEWEVLGDPFWDQVRNELRGTTMLLSEASLKRAVSAFTVMRVDRLPDGGIPMETDAGPKDSGIVIVIPPVPDAGRDAGRPDAGRPDAGRPDAGTDGGTSVDAGTDAGIDAGMPGRDAGVDAGFDAGIDARLDAGIDAGFDAGIDAGVDAGMRFDAGLDAGVDGGEDAGLDAGIEVDAGTDAGSGADAGSGDAGEPDAGDAG